jgi:hypothetical protein
MLKLAARPSRGRGSTTTRGTRARRMLAPLVAALAVLALAAPAGMAAPSTATITAAFSADFYSASIDSTKGVSHYDVTLCDGSAFRVEITQDTKSATAGPFDAQIVSLSVKSATTAQTFYSGFSGDCKKVPPPPPPPKK